MELGSEYTCIKMPEYLSNSCKSRLDLSGIYTSLRLDGIIQWSSVVVSILKCLNILAIHVNPD